MINTIVVENEKQHSDYITALLSKHFPEISILAVCNSVPAGVEKIKLLRPRLVFLDVELHPYTGFDLLEQTRELNFEVIFTTSFNKYAAKAFRFCALDFIEKPFGVDDLKEAITRFKNIFTNGSRKNIDALLHNVKQSDASLQKVGIPVLGGLDFLQVADIIMCQSEDNCTNFHLTGKKKILATKTLKWVEELLHDTNFFRVHDSYLINLSHIKKYKRGGEGGVVELTEQKEADVSRRKKDDFLKVLSNLGMIR